MKVALLHNLNRGQSEHETEFDLPLTIDAIKVALSKKHNVVPIECSRDFPEWMSQLISEKPDIAFNVAEGYAGAAREALYPALCEQIGIPYTGPGPTELLVCHNKGLTKKLIGSQDIPTAWSVVIHSPSEIDNLNADQIPFPLIVKLNTEGSSLGMDENCIVGDLSQLRKQVSKLHTKFGADIIAEQFIEGRDLSTSYIEGLGVFGPVEYTYPTGSIYDYRLKSSENDKVGVHKPQNFSQSDHQRIRNITEEIVGKLDLNGYGRADFRFNPSTGDLIFLEMNAQVCFHPDGAFILGVTEHSSRTYEDVVLHIVDHAMQKRRRISRIGIL